MSMPAIPPGTFLAVPMLDPIPASNAPTPAVDDAADVPGSISGENTSALLEQSFSHDTISDYHTPSEEVPGRRSRRSSGFTGSYFPSSPTLDPTSSYAASPESITRRLREKPRPAPVSIPSHPLDQSLLPANPKGGASTVHNIRRSTFSRRDTTFTLLDPPPGRGRLRGLSSLVVESIDSAASTGRTRSTTFSFNPENSVRSYAVGLQEQQVTPDSECESPSMAPAYVQPRRYSVGGHEHFSQWPSLAAVDVGPSPERPTIDPVSQQSTTSTILTLDPATTRRLSAANDTELNAVVLGLSNLVAADGPIHVVTAEEITAPHGEPPRHPSIESGAYIQSKKLADPMAIVSSAGPDEHSLFTASLSGTDTATSAGFYSTPSTSNEHPLSSATTSLSRSTKSGKEGNDSIDKDATLALRLQRSLEWEARQKRHIDRMEQLKHVALELVETELTHTEGLRKLVHVYLPTMRRTFVISESSWQLIVRNVQDVLELHERILGNMIDVLKQEEITYHMDIDEGAGERLERMARRLVRVLIDESRSFDAVYVFSAGSSVAESIIGKYKIRAEYASFERVCNQSEFALDQHLALRDILEGAQPASQASKSCPVSPARETSASRSRLRFEDHLILPVQRVCRYPLLIDSLSKALTPSSPVADSPAGENDEVEFAIAGDEGDEFDLREAHSIMSRVAKQTDEARRVRDEELKSELVIQRLEPHPFLPISFLRNLGSCSLIAAFDVLYLHQMPNPIPTNKPKYWATLIYPGFIVFAKVKRATTYEIKHFFPLETSTIIYIEDGELKAI